MRLPITLFVVAASVFCLPSLSAQTGTEKADKHKYGSREHDTDKMSRASLCVTASKLLSHDVTNREDEDKGQIEELALDADSGRILFALVACEDHDEKLFAVPLRQLEIANDADDKDELVVRWTPTETDLAMVPSIPKDDWTRATSPTFAHTVRTHFDDDMDTPQAVGDVDIDRPRVMQILRVSELVGSDVKGLVSDEEVGEVKDLVIDSSSGCVHFVVVDTDTGLLDTGDTRAVPLAVLQHRAKTSDADAHCIITASKESLETAPKFDEKDLRSSNSTAFVSEVYRHFGVPMPEKKDDATQKDGSRDDDTSGTSNRKPVRQGSGG